VNGTQYVAEVAKLYHKWVFNKERDERTA